MKKLLITGSNDSLRINSKSITNLHLEVVYSYPTLSAGTNTNINLSAVNIQSEIKQASKKIDFTTFALPSHLRFLSQTNIKSGLVLEDSPLATTQVLGFLLDNDGTTTTRSIIVPIYESDLNLSKDEYIDIKVQQLSSLVGSAVGSASFYICYDDATDVKQPFLRIPRYTPLNSSVTEVLKSVDYADNIFLTAFKSQISSDFVLSSINVGSKFLDIQYDINDVLKVRNSKLINLSDVLPIVDFQGETYLKNVDIKLDVNTANVTSNVDFLVYDQIIPCRELYIRFAEKIDKYNFSKKDDLIEISEDC